MQTERIIWPLGIVGWTGRWTLLAWCELRQGYRNFRLDRFQSLEIMPEHFTPTNEISISHYLKNVIGIDDKG